MPLHLLLDENISQVIAEQVRKHRPELVIRSVHTWQDGTFRGRHDKELLSAAAAEGLTLVTYDQKTIPDILAEMFAANERTMGVIFVDDLTIANDDFGLLIRALLVFWERYQSLDWQDRVYFLDKP